MLSISGGKDSTALALHGIEEGLDREHTYFAFADTGNELPETIAYVAYLSEHLKSQGYRGVQTVKADFSRRMETRKNNLRKFWKDLPEEKVELALANLEVTGNPFLDLCKLKGRFPSTRARFCTQELKTMPIQTQVIDVLVEQYDAVLSWQGVRAEESSARAKLPQFELQFGEGDDKDTFTGVATWRPLLHWKVEDVFGIHHQHGIKPNPLYKQGMSRVGCAPCIHSRKAEVREFSKRFPAEVDRIRYWEQEVRKVSKRGDATFFAADKVPGNQGGESHIDAVVEWSKTTRGGLQFDLLSEEEPPSCSSQYGLCE